jgi:plastocyanin
MHLSQPAERRGHERRGGRSMRAALVSVFAAAVLVTALAGSVRLRAAWAQEDPSFDGVTIEIFGSGEPSATPGNALVLRRITIDPEASLPPHSHPGAVTFTVASGELAYTLLAGDASVQRGPEDDGAAEVESLEVDEETALATGDSIFVEGAIATATNPGDEPAILWASSLLDADAPFLVEEEIEDEEPVEETTPESTPEDEEEAEPEGVRVSLDEFTIRLSSSIPSGETTFVITNRGAVNHSFVIVGEGAEASLDSPVRPEQTAELTVDLPPGTYQILCPVANHDALGMTRELVVTDSGEGDGGDGADEEEAGEEDAEDEAEEEAEADAPVDGQIQIAGFQFGPAEVEVTVGSTVTWTNFDGATHTATADDGTFDSGDIPAGEEFSFTFEVPGTFSYFCEIHPDMVGTVTVTE